MPSYELMSRAGAEAFRILRRRWPDARAIVVLCGAGNNAGDGLVLARHAKAAGLDLRVLAVAPPERLKGDAKRALDECVSAGIAIERFAGLEKSAGRPIVVDALLGIGADRPLAGDFAAAVAAANALGAPILALDIPSGLHADTGLPLGDAIRATATVTFVGLKQGLYLGRASITRATSSSPTSACRSISATTSTPALTRLALPELAQALPPRPRSAHKGTNGRLLMRRWRPRHVGRDPPRVRSRSARRRGPRLRRGASATVPLRCATGVPRSICRMRCDTASELAELVDARRRGGRGTGLGRAEWAQACLGRVLASGAAAGRRRRRVEFARRGARRSRQLDPTPHPGEAARLARQLDGGGAARPARVGTRARGSLRRGGRAQGLAHPRRGGRRSAPPPSAIAAIPGMASGGMGDVLAGSIGALLVADARHTDERARGRAAACARGRRCRSRAAASAARSRATCCRTCADGRTPADNPLPALKQSSLISQAKLARRLAAAKRWPLADRACAASSAAGKTTWVRAHAARSRLRRAGAVADLHAARALRPSAGSWSCISISTGSRGERELENLGLARLARGLPRPGCLIEWPERAPALPRRCDLLLEFAETGARRRRRHVGGRTRAGIEALEHSRQTGLNNDL